MNVIQLNKGLGKSVIAIHQAMNKKCPLVVPNDEARTKLNTLGKYLAECNGCEILKEAHPKIKVYTFQEYKEMVKSGKLDPKSDIVFDDFDRIMEQELGVDSSKVTITTI